ncbi:MAG: acetoacetate--CoA ligase [Alphaproteobacteria bacterium]|nr:acetoacetate--CoA ligase [Alphaproteobacteria bacterium]
MTHTPHPLWTPSPEQIRAANITAFVSEVEAHVGCVFSSYHSFYQWSVDQDAQFWSLFWDFCRVKASVKGETSFQQEAAFEKCRFFPEARLNYAENMLRTRTNAPAIIFWQENKTRVQMSFNDLYDAVSRFSQALRQSGVKPLDRIAAVGPNRPEMVIAMLAVTSIGAIWSSCSPDFGVPGIVDRFGQIEPKILIACQDFIYKGVSFDIADKIIALEKELPTLEEIILVPSLDNSEASFPRKVCAYHDFVAPFTPSDITFEIVPFDHPLFILFSSGTTGKPKCIVHGHGGVLLQHLKEHQLHCDLKPGDRLFYYSTTSWMMWNWLVSALGSGVTLLLYDGSPFHPNPNILFDYLEQEKATHFGTSAKYIDALHKAEMSPRKTHDLSHLRMILSTGSPLVAESFAYVYKEISANVCLASISGGTDIVSCFALGNPVAPVWPGELQTRGLGLAVDVFDAEGKPVRGQKGELVCTKPFPCMPVSFWNDSDGARYHKSYFEHFPGIWRHGDFVELTSHDGIIIHGRSDTILNPGGVRIGTAEIYRQVEQLDEVMESLVVAQQWDGDVRVILFVKLRDTDTLTDELRTKIRLQIRENTTPRHVPAKILQVPDIPRTATGKIVEMAVTDIIHGRPVINKEALANPQALSYYENLDALKS